VNARPAIFLDRDGTIIADAHYLSEPAQVVLLPRAPDALLALRNAGYALFLFTNQSGIGRGFFTLEDAQSCNTRMIELLGLGRELFTDICIAPEAPDHPSVYRKPSPRFITESIARHGLDATKCWMVGDKASDIEAGLNAGIRSAWINAAAAEPRHSAVPRYASLFEFAQAVTCK
jgi:D-glycero-D-manno-heptose 1,7-bisphosphate phosphatase